MKEIRTRFAPSPTGHLHIGGARTALFNYLFARRNGGKFILRIEDTDRERSTEEAKEAILDGMHWLGLTWDEGPFYQTERLDLYKKYLHQLIESGSAYRCYCTAQELEARRKQQMAEGKPPQYDRRCREKIGINLDLPHTFRFLVPDGETVVEDLVRGSIRFQNTQIEDLVIARSDGMPTYNFVVVVDDLDMRISHVIRGDDHLNNTPKQILLYQALGKEVPIFAHLPLILGQDKKRLSKRHGATSVQAYRDMGYLPEAVVNFLARLGWSHGDQEIFSMEELIEKFDFDHVGKSSGVFNAEKLLWLNQHYIKSVSYETLIDSLSLFFNIPESMKNHPGSRKLIDSLRERSKTLEEMARFSQFYFFEKVHFDEEARKQYLTQEVLNAFLKLRDLFQETSDLQEASIKPKFEALLQTLNMKMGKVAQPLRVALVGGTISPGIFEVIELLGKDKVLDRLQDAILYIQEIR